MRVYVNKNARGWQTENNKNYDVVVKIHKDKEQRTAVFRFYRNSELKITKTGYVAVSYDAEKKAVYFEESDSKMGYKITHSNRLSVEVKVSNRELRKWIEKYSGKYFLEFDKGENCFCINLCEEAPKEE